MYCLKHSAVFGRSLSMRRFTYYCPWFLVRVVTLFRSIKFGRRNKLTLHLDGLCIIHVEKNIASFWFSTQRAVAIRYRRFGTTCRSHHRCVMTQKNAVLLYFAAEDWNYEPSILGSVTFSAAVCRQNPNTILVRSDIFTMLTVTVAAFLERDAVWSGRWVPTFYRNPLSG